MRGCLVLVFAFPLFALGADGSCGGSIEASRHSRPAGRSSSKQSLQGFAAPRPSSPRRTAQCTSGKTRWMRLVRPRLSGGSVVAIRVARSRSLPTILRT